LGGRDSGVGFEKARKGHITEVDRGKKKSCREGNLFKKAELVMGVEFAR